MLEKINYKKEVKTMQPYKSIFKESNDMFNSNQEAKQIVDISNLEWGKTFKANWDSAQSECPSGWRLPTIQELYTAYAQKVKGFKSYYYWSSSTYAQNTIYAWHVVFNYGFVNYNYKTDFYYVRCVRDL